MSMPATIGPTPKISVNVVPDAATAAVIRALESRMDDIEVVDLVDQLDRLPVPFKPRPHRRVRSRRAAIVPG